MHFDNDVLNLLFRKCVYGGLGSPIARRKVVGSMPANVVCITVDR